MLAALLLDFDGLLYDTESAAYAAWERLYAAHGAQMSLQRWVSEAIGRAPADQSFDPLVELERITGERFDRAAVRARRDAERQALLPHELMPGADALLAAARSRGLRTAIVTSNSRAKVDGHLARAGTAHQFDAIVCADGDAARSKPRPTLYLEALALLGLTADQAVAFEDSPNGIAAARAAGLYCVAVPNRLTRVASGVRAADRLLGSLADVDLDELARAAS